MGLGGAHAHLTLRQLLGFLQHSGDVFHLLFILCDRLERLVDHCNMGPRVNHAVACISLAVRCFRPCAIHGPWQSWGKREGDAGAGGAEGKAD